MSADTTTSPPYKRTKTTSASASDPPYELFYWPGIPGRGEFVRVVFEATSTPYKDVVSDTPDGKPNIPAIYGLLSDKNTGTPDSAPPCAPPILKHGDLIISQVPNICQYVATRIGLASGSDDEDKNAIYKINALAMTALDGFSNEAHNTHHPVAIELVYEDQKDEARRFTENYIANRLPKFLGYFERVLQGPASKGGEWLYGGHLTWADLVLWQSLDGVGHAFPKAMGQLKGSGKYSKVFEHQDRVAQVEGLKGYLASGRRKKYGNGIWRYYEELDLPANV